MAKKPKISSKKRISRAGKNYLKAQGVSPVSARYYNYFRELCREFVDQPKYNEFESEDLELSKPAKYFVFVKENKNFENPFFHNSEALEKLVARKFGVNQRLNVTVIENRADGVEIVVSKDVIETAGDSKTEVFHGILLIVGNFGLSTDELIDEEVRRTLL